MGKNRGSRLCGSIEILEEDGFWGNGEIFGSLGSWVKYGENMEGTGKCGSLFTLPAGTIVVVVVVIPVVVFYFATKK